jgi:methylthioribose-1-phosphate isomerase
VDWTGEAIRIIDQTLLPGELRYVELRSLEELGDAIKSMQIRGAPAIGVAAALGVALAVQKCPEADVRERAVAAAEYLRTTRPTAVNLAWALDKMKRVAEVVGADGGTSVKERLISEAVSIMQEDRELCRRIGENGARLLEDGFTVLTHCNAGALATSGMGTALAAVYAAVEQGKKIDVFADETRPLLQGARLSAWELVSRKIAVTVICDSAAAWLMGQGKVDCVLVGADRVARNGDLANKVGSYSLAIAAREHGVPFYVACPYSTIDCSLADGSGIPIEERAAEEVRFVEGRRIVPEAAGVYNPAFDVVPHRYVSAVITERDVFWPPFGGKLCQE